MNEMCVQALVPMTDDDAYDIRIVNVIEIDMLLRCSPRVHARSETKYIRHMRSAARAMRACSINISLISITSTTGDSHSTHSSPTPADANWRIEPKGLLLLHYFPILNAIIIVAPPRFQLVCWRDWLAFAVSCAKKKCVHRMKRDLMMLEEAEKRTRST